MSYESDGHITYVFPSTVNAGDRAFIVTDMLELYWHICDGSEAGQIVQIDSMVHSPIVVSGWHLVEERK